MVSTILGFITVLTFSLIYYLNFEFLYWLDQKKLTSFVAGFGMVYVIIYMLPQLAHGQRLLQTRFPNHMFLSNNATIYIITLFGSVFFYLFELLLSLNTEYKKKDKFIQEQIYNYWMHIVFFASYNLLIGLVIGFGGLNNLFQQIVYLIAYAIHFMAIRWGTYNLDTIKYNHFVRYLFIALLLLGYFLALFISIPAYVLAIFEAFITGGMILLVFNHEIPIKKNSDQQALIRGVVIAILLFIFIA